MSKRDTSRFIAITGFLAAGLQLPAHAQSLALNDIGNGFQGAASLDIAYVRADNFFYQAAGGVSTEGYFLRPNVLLNRDNGTLNYRFRATGDYSVYDLPSSLSNYQDEYFDANAALGVDWQAGTRNHFGFNADFRKDHDPLGLNAPVTNTTTVIDADEYHQSSLGAVYRFGAKEALLNLEFRAGTRDRNYTNNDASTRFLDYRNDNVGSTAYINISPKTAILFDLHYSTVEFALDDPTTGQHGNAETRYRTGIQWKATAKTTGDIRVGYSSVDYDIGRERNRLNWTGSVVWSPASRSSFTFLTGRSNQETYLATNSLNALSIENDDYAVSWTQRWGSRVQSLLTRRLVIADFVGYSASGIQSNREDRFNSTALSIEYNITTFLTLIGSVAQSDRDSTISANDYRSNINHIGIRLTP